MKKLLLPVLVFATAFASLPVKEAHAVRIKSSACKKFYREWKDYSGHKAFYVTVDGLHCGYDYNWSTIEKAKASALKYCKKFARGGKCVLYKAK